MQDVTWIIPTQVAISYPPEPTQSSRVEAAAEVLDCTLSAFAERRIKRDARGSVFLILSPAGRESDGGTAHSGDLSSRVIKAAAGMSARQAARNRFDSVRFQCADGHRLDPALPGERQGDDTTPGKPHGFRLDAHADFMLSTRARRTSRCPKSSSGSRRTEACASGSRAS